MAFHPPYRGYAYPESRPSYPERHGFHYGYDQRHEPRPLMEPYYHPYERRGIALPTTPFHSPKTNEYFHLPPPAPPPDRFSPAWSNSVHSYPYPDNRYGPPPPNYRSHPPLDQYHPKYAGRDWRYPSKEVPEAPPMSTSLSIGAPSTTWSGSWAGSQSRMSSSRASNDGSYDSYRQGPIYHDNRPPSYHSDDFGLGRLSLGSPSGQSNLDDGYAASESSFGRAARFTGPDEPDHQFYIEDRERDSEDAESDRLSTAVDQGYSPRRFESEPSSRAHSEYASSGYSEFGGDDRDLDEFSERFSDYSEGNFSEAGGYYSD